MNRTYSTPEGVPSYFEEGDTSAAAADVSRDRMKAGGKKVKRRRSARTTFEELVRKLWQADSEGLEPKVVAVTQKKSVGKSRRTRKS